jgi:hypothetical protein
VFRRLIELISSGTVRPRSQRHLRTGAGRAGTADEPAKHRQTRDRLPGPDQPRATKKTMLRLALRW